MNTPCTFILALLTAGLAVAQDNPAPAPAAAPAQSEMQKWIATTDEQWQASFKRGVTDVHEAELNKVKLQYLTMLEDGIKKASGASDLDGALALRNEQKRFGDASLLPGSNPFPAQDDAADAAAVKQIRAAIRTQLAKLEKDSAARAKALHAKYDQVLAQAQSQLTQRQRLDDALLVKNKRDEVAAAWITPPIAVAAEKAMQPTSKPAPSTPPVVPPRAAESTAGNLFQNANFNNGTESWTIMKTGTVTIDTDEQHNGKASVRITNSGGTRTMVMQKIQVQPKSRYLLSAYIKTKDVVPVRGPMTKKLEEGAELVVDGPLGGSRRSDRISKTTSGWTQVKYTVVTGPSETQIDVGFALGHYYGPVTGTAWFSEVSLTDLRGKN